MARRHKIAAHFCKTFDFHAGHVSGATNTPLGEDYFDHSQRTGGESRQCADGLELPQIDLTLLRCWPPKGDRTRLGSEPRHLVGALFLFDSVYSGRIGLPTLTYRNPPDLFHAQAGACTFVWMPTAQAERFDSDQSVRICLTVFITPASRMSAASNWRK
jgi:hypothetical protein